jgi:hypothetical protein
MWQQFVNLREAQEEFRRRQQQARPITRYQPEKGEQIEDAEFEEVKKEEDKNERG